MPKKAIASFPSKRHAEDAIKALITRSGYSLGRFSIASGEFTTEEKALRFYNTGDRVRRWSSWAGLWGFIWGLFFGPLIAHSPWGNNLPGIVHVPQLGHYLSFHVYASPLGWLLGAVINAVVWAAIAAIGSWIFSFGTPRNSVIEYDSFTGPKRVELLFDGTDEEANDVQGLLAIERQHAEIQSVSQ